MPFLIHMCIKHTFMNKLIMERKKPKKVKCPRCKSGRKQARLDGSWTCNRCGPRWRRDAEGVIILTPSFDKRTLPKEESDTMPPEEPKPEPKKAKGIIKGSKKKDKKDLTKKKKRSKI